MDNFFISVYLKIWSVGLFLGVIWIAHVGNDWIRAPLKLLIVQELIVQSYDFVLTSSFQYFTTNEMTITCLVGLVIYHILPWLERNLVAERE